MRLADFRPSRLIAATDSLRDVAVIYGCASLVFTTLFSLAEGIPWTDALYWCGITATSLGYGDITPKSDLGKTVAYVWAHVGIYGIAPLIVVRYMESVMDQRESFTHREQERMFNHLEALLERVDDLHAQKFPEKNFLLSRISPDNH